MICREREIRGKRGKEREICSKMEKRERETQYERERVREKEKQ